MITNSQNEKRPASVQAERDDVNLGGNPTSQSDIIPANDNLQGMEVSNPQSLVPEFKIFKMGEAELPPKAEPFIEDLLYPGQISLLYGASGIGKSAVAVDMLVRASLGLTFAGKQTKPVDVLWIPTENPQEFQHRLDGCIRTHQSLSKGDESHWFTLAQLSLVDKETQSKMIILAQHLRENANLRQQVIVIDTVAQGMPGIDENASAGMTQLIYNIRFLLSMVPNAHCLLVHHSGKHKERGARGHSSLTAAADTEIAMFGTQLHVVNQRSGPKDIKIKFKLLGRDYTDENGEVLSTVGVEYP